MNSQTDISSPPFCQLCLHTRIAAKDKRLLQGHNISHVLNAAHGKHNVNTGASYYRDTKITYHGVEAFDMSSFDLSPFFYSAAKFIRSGMDTPGGMWLVNSELRTPKNLYGVQI